MAEVLPPGICAVNNINVQDIDIEELKKRTKSKVLYINIMNGQLFFDIRYILLNIISHCRNMAKIKHCMKDSS